MEKESREGKKKRRKDGSGEEIDGRITEREENSPPRIVHGQRYPMPCLE